MVNVPVHNQLLLQHLSRSPSRSVYTTTVEETEAHHLSPCQYVCCPNCRHKAKKLTTRSSNQHSTKTPQPIMASSLILALLIATLMPYTAVAAPLPSRGDSTPQRPLMPLAGSPLSPPPPPTSPALSPNHHRRLEMCAPGTYRCADPITVEVCGELGTWRISSLCRSGRCSIEEGRPVCSAPAARSRRHPHQLPIAEEVALVEVYVRTGLG